MVLTNRYAIISFYLVFNTLFDDGRNRTLRRATDVHVLYGTKCTGWDKNMSVEVKNVPDGTKNVLDGT